MIKALMIGGGFQHQKAISINNKNSKNFEWVKDGDHDVKIFIDEAIIDNIGKSKDKKYAFIFESRSIFVRDFIYSNYKILLDSYELIFTHDEDLLKLHENFVFIPANSFWINNLGIRKKTKLVSFITSNKNTTIGHKKRFEIFNRLPRYVDTYGFNISPITTKEEGLEDYMFSICVENDKYNHYFTEKILDCFAVGTIPIYWGCPSIGNFFNKNGIIEYQDDFDFNTLSPELYYSKINFISENLEKIKQYEVLEDLIFDSISKKTLIV